jgi:hypothetical protein
MLILKMCLWDTWTNLDNNRIVDLEEKYMVIILPRWVIIVTKIIMLSLVEIWVQLS